MKNLLKILALWLAKILQINLIELYTFNQYTFEHLKKMIHKLDDDYNTFTYTPFLVEVHAVRSINDKTDVELYIPLLVDCLNEVDAGKVGRNISDWLCTKGYYTNYLPNKNVTFGYKSNLDDPQDRSKILNNTDFKSKLQIAIEKTKSADAVLNIDLLEGSKTIRKITKIYNSSTAPHDFNILVSEPELIEILNN